MPSPPGTPDRSEGPAAREGMAAARFRRAAGELAPSRGSSSRWPSLGAACLAVGRGARRVTQPERGDGVGPSRAGPH